MAFQNAQNFILQSLEGIIMNQLKNIISIAILTVFILFSHSCLSDGNESKTKEVQAIPIEEIVENTDSLMERIITQGTELFDLNQLKWDLDSFVMNVKRTQLPFELNTDTVNINSSDKDLWAFQKGIFELINIDSTKQLVRHHFSIPKTKRILRIYLLELQYSSIQESNMFFKKLDSRKDYEADLTGGYFMYYGLTGTTDYVIKSNETILWFNVSCQYTKKEFKKLIEIFRRNILLKGNEEIIKCFCQQKYE